MRDIYFAAITINISLDESHVNTNANHREFWLGDLDGYVVVLIGAYGDLGESG